MLLALYASCLAGNLVEQLWNFAWPAAIALIHPSLLPVAVMGFFAKVSVPTLSGPLRLEAVELTFELQKLCSLLRQLKGVELIRGSW